MGQVDVPLVPALVCVCCSPQLLSPCPESSSRCLSLGGLPWVPPHPLLLVHLLGPSWAYVEPLTEIKDFHVLDSSPHWCWSPSISTLSKTASSSDTFHGEAEFQNLILLAVVNLHKAGDGKLGQKIKGKMIPVTLKSKVNLLMCSGSLHLFLHKQWCSSHSKGLFPALENWFCTDLNGLIETLNRNSLL